jgi:hypothetical protein
MKLRTLFPLIIVAALLLSPLQAFAAPIVSSVEPGTIANTHSASLVIRGSGFVSGAVVLLDGVGALETSFVSEAVLTALVPAGAPAGTFGVSVVLPDASSGRLDNAITILGPTATPQPTHTPHPTAFVRPLLVVQSYGASAAELTPGWDIDFEMTLVNSGQSDATNVAATFVSGDLVPRATGGVRAIGTLPPGQSNRFFQPFTVGAIAGQSVATLEVRVSYNDIQGTAYSETFTLTFPVARPRVGPGATATPTPTPTPTATQPNVRPQLLITNYGTGEVQLQPGTRFTLQLDVQNLGAGSARRVTMIAGGGTSSTPSGTPDPTGPGGVSGSGGDFTNFAPVGASNVQSLGDLPVGGSLHAEQTFVVNASTRAGAYPMKFSFVYVDENSVAYTDDQVITLLVYQPPQVDVSFYRETGPMYAYQPNMLPLQIVNLGRNSTVLGNMRVTGENAQFANNVILVGALDPGGFFTLDATYIPEQPGQQELLVTVDYTDDFNEQRRITQTITVEVLDMPSWEPPDGGNGGPFEPVPQPELTLWQRFVRFLRAMFGLDTGQPAGPGMGPGQEGPPIDGPIDGPIGVPGGKG